MSGLNTKNSTVEHWDKIANDMLKGQKVKACRYMDAEEVEALGWSSAAVIIEFESGLAIYPSRDDEGNDAGALFTTDKHNDTLPVI